MLIRSPGLAEVDEALRTSDSTGAVGVPVAFVGDAVAVEVGEEVGLSVGLVTVVGDGDGSGDEFVPQAETATTKGTAAPTERIRRNRVSTKPPTYALAQRS